jgi:trehalose/maltose hydrolase-like predicted phosphorylase
MSMAWSSDDGWYLRYEGLEPDQEGLREALCTLGNGYMATRGAAPEARADGIHYPGTYLAGIYDRLTSTISGREVENEDLVNAPDWLALGFRVGRGAWFDARATRLLAHHLELDLRRGVLTRRLRFRDRSQRTTSVVQRRLVSMESPHLAGLETTFLAEDWSGPLTVRSAIDGRVTNSGVARYRQLRGDHLVPLRAGAGDGESLLLEVETQGSHIRIAEAARTRVLAGIASEEPDTGGEAPPTPSRRLRREPGFVAHDLTLELTVGVPVTVEKIVTVFTSRDAGIYEPAHAAREALALAPGFETALRQHVLAWDRLWSRFETRLSDTTRAQLILRLHLFHLLQTSSPHTIDLDVGVPARGLHGEAYRGHIFWDELFILPLLDVHLPAIARSLLEYRYRRLPEARLSAARAGFRGAMYPWQSGSDGREASQTWHLNPRSGRWLPDHSHLQRHIGIAIAYNAWAYWEATGDATFLRWRGGPMLIEIARFLASAATYERAHDRYVIRGVIGPDEYHDAYPGSEQPGIDNNAYTNVMAVCVLLRALQVLSLLPSYERDELWQELGLAQDELDRWQDITRRMLVPFHGQRILSQFEGYEELEELDWDGYRARYGDIHRLDRILEAEGDTTDRYKASKQADALMIFYLLSPDHVAALLGRLGYPFDPDEDTRRNVEYYLRRTSHGSTLSRVVHSWVLSRLDRHRSWQLLVEALESDVSDIQGGTTAEGIHLGAMAGTVDLVQRGYGGIELRDGVVHLDPRLPEEMASLAFSVQHRGQRLDIEIDHQRVRIGTQPDLREATRVSLGETTLVLEPGQSGEIPLEVSEAVP